MRNVHHLFVTVLFFLFHSTTALNIVSSCITNTPCKCHLTDHSFTLINCSYTLPDLPVLNTRAQITITRLIARNALVQWPSHICKYSNVNTLDLSGSHFDSRSLDLSCLSQLVHLNLSNSQLRTMPKSFLQKNNVSKYLQTIDLSNNLIRQIDFVYFRPLLHLNSISFRKNPIERIQHFDDLFTLPQLELVDLISSHASIVIEQHLTAHQWLEIVRRWKSFPTSLVVRANTIALQTVLPSPHKLLPVEPEMLSTILKKLSNSIFTTLLDAPKCNCTHLRYYQRVLSSINSTHALSPLFQSATCLMSNGIVHAHLFDPRTLVDSHCPVLARKILPIATPSSSSSLAAVMQFFLLVPCVLVTY